MTTPGYRRGWHVLLVTTTWLVQNLGVSCWILPTTTNNGQSHPQVQADNSFPLAATAKKKSSPFDHGDDEQKKKKKKKDPASLSLPLNNPSRQRILRHGALVGVITATTILLLPSGATTTTTTTTILPRAVVAQAAMEKVSVPTPEQAQARFRAGRQSIQYLLDHYDEIIAAGGGDNVRRYLGTVGMTSGLVQIDKVMTVLAERIADDDVFIDYTETQNEVIQSIQQANGSAYMAIFVTTSPSETPPEKYFNDAKIEIKNCIRAMDHLATLIGLSYE